MKSSTEKEDKSKLCKNSDDGECSELLHQRFAIKYINSLICASYLITVVIALALTTYIHYVGEHKSQEIQFNFEKFVESELLKFKEYNNINNNKENERLYG